VPKTVPAGDVTVPATGATFRANAMPDPFDARDLEYRPRLQPLPAQLDVRPKEKTRYHVMTQQGDSCTGHAVAALINTVLAQQGRDIRVSPYMLYAMARRYDDISGEADQGSSLRGALKGWYYHGVLPESAWPDLDPAKAPDIDEPSTAELAMREPLGAFYRVNAFRLDDMQSAITELHAIVVSAAIHDGWQAPVVVEHKSAGSDKVDHLAVIQRRPGSHLAGGHAFALVGYNEVGFLVQNSWGPKWGRGGFATLPYEDWLTAAYDAWVARPGVPTIVPQRAHTRTVATTSGIVGNGPGPDLQRLDRHVVNLGLDGRLSDAGRFASTPAQLDRVVERMADYHAFWAAGAAGTRRGGRRDRDSGPAPRRVVLYAHGGLSSESDALTIAWRQLAWWLNNRVYPVTFAWQSGAAEGLLDTLTDLAHPKLPPGGLGFDQVEQFDRRVEQIARDNARWMWEQVKDSVRRTTAPFAAGRRRWPAPATGSRRTAMAALPGAALTVDRIRTYAESVEGGLELHLVGHGAGALLVAGLLDRLDSLPVASLTLLAPALRVDDFLDRVVPHLHGHVGAFATFGLDEQRELDDVCGVGGRTFYQKSLLYLVSRALETPAAGSAEVPLLGLARFARTEVGGRTVADEVAAVGGDLVWAPSEKPADSRTDCTHHDAFDADSPTMTSVLLRVLGATTPTAAMRFQAYVQRAEAEPPGSAGGQTPPLVPADVGEKGSVPTTKVAAARRRGAPAPAPTAPADGAVAALEQRGWRAAGSGAGSRAATQD